MSSAGIMDESFVFVRMVDNLYLGYGLTFNSGLHQVPLDSPSWLATLIILKGISIPSILTAPAGSVALALIAFIYIVFQKTDDGRSIWPIIPLALIALPGFRIAVGSGLETGLILFLLTLIFIDTAKDGPIKKPFYTGLLFSFLYLTVGTMIWPIIYFTIFLIQDIKRTNPGARPLIKLLAPWFAGLLLPALLFHAFLYSYADLLFFSSMNTGNVLSNLKEFIIFLALSPAAWIIIVTGLTSFFKLDHAADHQTYPGEFSAIRIAGSAILLLVTQLLDDSQKLDSIKYLPSMMLIAIAAHKTFASHQDIFRNKIKKLIPGYNHSLAVIICILLTFIPARAADTSSRFLSVENIRNPENLLNLWKQPRKFNKYYRLRECLALPEIRLEAGKSNIDCMETESPARMAFNAGPLAQLFSPDIEVYSDKHLNTSLERALENRALFCETGDTQYDEIMRTPFGVIINWDINILFSVPDIGARFKELDKLQETGNKTVTLLEKANGVKVKSIQKELMDFKNDSMAKSLQSCWIVE